MTAPRGIWEQLTVQGWGRGLQCYLPCFDQKMAGRKRVQERLLWN